MRIIFILFPLIFLSGFPGSLDDFIRAGITIKFFIYNVTPGTTSAAKIKANFLKK